MRWIILNWLPLEGKLLSGARLMRWKFHLFGNLVCSQKTPHPPQAVPLSLPKRRFLIRENIREADKKVSICGRC